MHARGPVEVTWMYIRGSLEVMPVFVRGAMEVSALANLHALERPRGPTWLRNCSFRASAGRPVHEGRHGFETARVERLRADRSARAEMASKLLVSSVRGPTDPRGRMVCPKNESLGTTKIGRAGMVCPKNEGL